MPDVLTPSPDVTIATDPNGWTVKVRFHASHADLVLTGFGPYKAPIGFAQSIPLHDARTMAAMSKDANEAAALMAESPQEHEHKFLVINDSWRQQADAGEELKQLYVVRDPNGWLARVRIGETKSKLTVKGPRLGISNPEFEYTIPEEWANAVWSLSPGPRLMKRRYKVDAGAGLVWEIDDFISPAIKTFMKNRALAEIELPRPDTPFVKPDWVGLDVSTDPNYRNDSLVDRVARAGDTPSKPVRSTRPR